MYVRARVNNLATFTYNFPALDPSLVLYYPLDSSANPSNGFQTANFASQLPVYDASLAGSSMITYALNNSVTSFGDLSLNNTMGAQLVPQTVSGNYVVSNTSFALNISGGFSVSLWFSCSGQLNKRGTLISLPLNKTSNGIQIDISGPNMIYTGWNLPSYNISSTFTAAGLPTTGFNQISVNDNGDILVATTGGLYYSNKSYTNYTFSLATVITGNVVTVSLNNSGNALACVGTTAYSSTNFGRTWAAVVQIVNVGGYANRPFQQAVVTNTGKSYLTIQNNSAGYTDLFSSPDLFSTSYSNMNFGQFPNINPYSYSGNQYACVSYISFSSAGHGIANAPYSSFYYDATLNTWRMVDKVKGGCISDNGNYIFFLGNASAGNVSISTNALSGTNNGGIVSTGLTSVSSTGSTGVFYTTDIINGRINSLTNNSSIPVAGPAWATIGNNGYAYISTGSGASNVNTTTNFNFFGNSLSTISYNPYATATQNNINSAQINGGKTVNMIACSPDGTYLAVLNQSGPTGFILKPMPP
jgi:hypothetical protein